MDFKELIQQAKSLILKAKKEKPEAKQNCEAALRSLNLAEQFYADATK